MNLALPVASGSAGIGRFAVNALGAGLGFTLVANTSWPRSPRTSGTSSSSAASASKS